MAENLTTQEKQDLDAFIVKCVLTNATFPSERVGLNRTTIQQLLNEFSVDSLTNFGDFIEKKVTANGSSFKSRKGVLKFGQISASDLVANLHSIIKLKEFEEEKENLQNRIKELKASRELFDTPEEKRKKIDAELERLTATLTQS